MNRNQQTSNQQTGNRSNRKKKPVQQYGRSLGILNLIPPLVELCFATGMLAVTLCYAGVVRARPLVVPLARIALRRTGKFVIYSWRTACRIGSHLRHS